LLGKDEAYPNRFKFRTIFIGYVAGLVYKYYTSENIPIHDTLAYYDEVIIMSIKIVRVQSQGIPGPML